MSDKDINEVYLGFFIVSLMPLCIIVLAVGGYCLENIFKFIRKQIIKSNNKRIRNRDGN
jgi:hypothetical protein